MLATIPAIMAVATTVIEGASALLKLGKDVTPAYDLLKGLFGGKSVTEDELRDIRAKADALHNELQAQTEDGN